MTERGATAFRDLLLNRVRYSAFDYTPETFAGWWERLRRQRPTWIYGYASLAWEFARWLGERGQGDAIPGLRAIVTTAEIATPRMKEEIARAFGVPVHEEYGCAEVGSIANACEKGRLHLNSENLHIEILSEDGRLRREGKGRFILTELHNRAQPLLRVPDPRGRSRVRALKDVLHGDPVERTGAQQLAHSFIHESESIGEREPAGWADRPGSEVDEAAFLESEYSVSGAGAARIDSENDHRSSSVSWR